MASSRIEQSTNYGGDGNGDRRPSAPNASFGRQEAMSHAGYAGGRFGTAYHDFAAARHRADDADGQNGSTLVKVRDGGAATGVPPQ